MKELLLYCAGPITGVSYGESTDWREYVASKLPPYIKAVSPMRGKNYLARENSIKDSYEEHPLSCQKGITCRDRMDVMRCDMIFVNFLGAKKVSIGSVMEVAWADAYRKPIGYSHATRQYSFVRNDSRSFRFHCFQFRRRHRNCSSCSFTDTLKI